jgi:hypothetical protein
LPQIEAKTHKHKYFVQGDILNRPLPIFREDLRLARQARDDNLSNHTQKAKPQKKMKL